MSLFKTFLSLVDVVFFRIVTNGLARATRGRLFQKVGAIKIRPDSFSKMRSTHTKERSQTHHDRNRSTDFVEEEQTHGLHVYSEEDIINKENLQTFRFVCALCF